MDAIFLFCGKVFNSARLIGFEYRIFYNIWKNSRLMGFEFILFKIVDNLIKAWYNVVGK